MSHALGSVSILYKCSPMSLQRTPPTVGATLSLARPERDGPFSSLRNHDIMLMEKQTLYTLLRGDMVRAQRDLRGRHLTLFLAPAHPK